MPFSFIDSVSHHLTMNISNALSSFYAFVETCERNFQIFKDGLKQEYYDNHFEYRFVYRLRNFSVHSGLPVSTISCYILRSDGNNSKQTAFCISKNAFCEKEDKKDFRHEVQEKFQDEDAISIVPYLKDVKEVLFAIVEKIICDAADSLKEIGNLFSNYTNGFEERVGMNDLFLEGVGNDRLFFGGSLLLFSRYLSSFVSENDSIHIGDDDVSRETVRELSAYISNLF